MEHQLWAFEIGSDNIDEFMKAITIMPEPLQELADHRLSWRVSAETLDAVKNLWTGSSKEHLGLRNRDHMFVVDFALSSRLECFDRDKFLHGSSLGLSQTHTLSFLAVGVDALGKLAEIAGHPKWLLLKPEKYPMVSQEKVI